MNNNKKQNNTLTRNNTDAKNNNVAKNNSSGVVRQTVNKTVEAGKSNPVLALVILIVVLVLLYVLGNYVYDHYQQNNSVKILKESLLQGINDARNEYEVGGGKMPNSTYSNEYGLSFWMYVDDYSYRQGQRKFILRRGDLTTEVNPEVYLHPNHNTLQVNVSLMTDSKGETTPHQNVDATPEHANNNVGNNNKVKEDTSEGNNENPTTTTTKEGFTTCNCDEVKSSKDVLNNVNSNNPNVAHNYNNKVFDLISGNEVHKPNTHSKLFNNVVEQFSDSNNNANNNANNKEDCECDSVENKTVSESERQAFEDKCGKCFVDDFPLQKWVHVVISQYNQVLDIYVDGKLRSSCVMPGFPMLTQENLVLSPDEGFSGQMTGVTYYNTALGADEVYHIYKDGPQGSNNILANVPTWMYVIVAVLVLGVVVYSLTA
jgi:hypothetical protein